MMIIFYVCAPAGAILVVASLIVIWSSPQLAALIAAVGMLAWIVGFILSIATQPTPMHAPKPDDYITILPPTDDLDILFH